MAFGAHREAFDVPREVAYFNTANLSPLLHRVRDAGVEALERRGRPWTISSEDWFSDVERLRGLFARLVAGDAEGVALVPASSYGFAVSGAQPERARGRSDPRARRRVSVGDLHVARARPAFRGPGAHGHARAG